MAEQSKSGYSEEQQRAFTKLAEELEAKGDSKGAEVARAAVVEHQQISKEISKEKS